METTEASMIETVSRLQILDSGELLGLDKKRMTTMKMMPSEHYGYLIFESKPSIPREHQLTITVSFSDGKELTKTIKKAF